MTTTGLPTIAALVPADGESADPVLHAFIAGLQRRGLRVRGLAQELCQTDHGCSVHLIDLATGQRYGISQNLGRLSASCTVDPQGLAEASIVLRRIADDGADLAVFNRFSGMEAGGEGFASEMLEIMSRDIPTVVIVREKWLPAWREFTGGLACELRPELAALDAWFAALAPGQPADCQAATPSTT
jgi:nucleoside-triphosphatase THEP1